MTHCTTVVPPAWNSFNYIQRNNTFSSSPFLHRQTANTHMCSNTQIHTRCLSLTFPFMNFVSYLPPSFSFSFSLYFMGQRKRQKKSTKSDFVRETTLWVCRRLFFVLSLIESLLLFIRARQPGQQGTQSYADHIEGLHYLEASYFLFSLKGSVRERERELA